MKIRAIAEAYGVWAEKGMCKKYIGIERNRFVIDENGKIADAQVKVKPEDSVARRWPCSACAQPATLPRKIPQGGR